MMDRRRLIALFGGATAAWPLQLRAQQPGRTYRIGALALLPRDSPAYVALFDGLRRQGFVERQNLTIDPRGFGLHVEQFSDVAAQLVKAQVEVILPVGDAAIRAAQQATATIPILAIADDMLGAGLITSLAHPGGNTTGISILATELDGKRQQLLIELIPGVRRIAALVDSNTKAAGQLEALGDAARARGIELSLQRVAEPDEIVGAIDAAQAAGASGLNVLSSPLLGSQRQLIIERAAVLRLPAIYQWPEAAEEGGLAGYGPRLVQVWRDEMARQLVKLLQGVKPADLPVQQPTKFELVLNLKTARTMGLTIPEAMLDRAEKVIE